MSSLQGCQSNSSIDTPEANDAKMFYSCLKYDIDQLIAKSPRSRFEINDSIDFTNNNKNNNNIHGEYVYFDLTDIDNYVKSKNENNADSTEFKISITVSDLFSLMSKCDIDFSLIKEEGNDSIFISNEDAIKSLKPMVEDSRAYLHAKGVTDEEIDEMLNENNADETILVPLVIAIAEHENNLTAESKTLSLSMGKLPLFAISAYAVDIDWGRAGACAFDVLGGDVFDALKSSKTISKKVIKLALKKVLKRIMGPVGAAIAVYEFSKCYFL
jgi:hypothetical protein